jgi:hypothetical protein
LNPDFTIVTPCFRQLDWLRLCIASVRDQTLPLGPRNTAPIRSGSTFGSGPSTHSIEHFIQDGGTPGIEDLARELGAEFHRNGQLVFEAKASAICNGQYTIKIFSEPDSGMYDALNRGFARSRGSLVAWLNSDEQYLSGTLTKVAQIFDSDKEVDVLLGDVILADRELNPICYRRIMVPDLWHTRLVHLHSLSCAMFFRRECLPSPPFDPKWKVIGDAVLVENWLRERRRIRCCRIPLSLFTFTGENLSVSANGKVEKELWNSGLPPFMKWVKPLVVLLHLARRLVHRAYGFFKVSVHYHTPAGKVSWSGSLKGIWPKGGFQN